MGTQSRCGTPCDITRMPIAVTCMALRGGQQPRSGESSGDSRAPSEIGRVGTVLRISSLRATRHTAARRIQKDRKDRRERYQRRGRSYVRAALSLCADGRTYEQLRQHRNTYAVKPRPLLLSTCTPRKAYTHRLLPCIHVSAYATGTPRRSRPREQRVREWYLPLI